MPGDEDTEGTRRISGDQARRLREPGQDIVEDPSRVQRTRDLGELEPEVFDNRANNVGELEPTIIGRNPIVDNTPTADGRTPRQTREAATRSATSTIRDQSPESGPDGRSPDPRRSSDEAGTGSSATRPPEETDARRGRDSPTASTEASPARGNPPHYFTEQVHQVYYHDVIVYIEGEDVSSFLLGSIQISYGFGRDWNKCDLTLDNAGHRFTLTPENISGQFRRVSTTSSAGRSVTVDYDESAKANLWDRKSDINYNPVDPQSGGRRLPLHHWSSIFHKLDTIRVFTHNPSSERDEYIPVFTGFIINKPHNENYITGDNTIRVSCADVRYIINKMRVNQNTMLTVLPQTQTTSQADPTNTGVLNNLEVWRSQDNAQIFQRSFFADLVRSSTTFTNPWVGLNLPNLIATLTFLPSSASLIEEQDRAALERGNTQVLTESRGRLTELAREISPLQQRVEAEGLDSLSTADRDRYITLADEINSNRASRGDVDSILDGSYFEPDDQEQAEGNARSPNQTTPQDPPTGSPGSSIDPSGNRQTLPDRGSGRIGRMRPGVFPWSRETVSTDPPRSYWRDCYFPAVNNRRQTVNHLQGWYNLCFFGSPVRHEFPVNSSGQLTRRPTTEAEDAPQDHSLRNRRYWTETEVRSAGYSSRRDGAWHPTAQNVHFLAPGPSVPVTETIWTMQTIAGLAVSTNHNWTTRLDLLHQACTTVDYKFWVSGAGDLIFEFTQYDFEAADYGNWKEVLTLDHHLLSESFDEEAGDITSGVVANGSFVALEDINEQQITRLHPSQSVGIWSPNLASRHGINIKVLQLSQITDTNRLEQLATLEFQKLLAAADAYSLEVGFRPWLTLNRPIFNKYRERIALIDGLSITIPVTAGAIAGNNAPSTSLKLNYSRSYDEAGIPRFITGGPSQPMYFGVRNSGADRNLTRSLQRRVRDFSAALRTLQESPTLTSQQFEELQRRYRAIMPNRQSTFNVINAVFVGSESLPDGEVDPITTELEAINGEMEELAYHRGATTKQERRDRLAAIQARVEELHTTLRERDEVQPETEQTSAGRTPDLGYTGVRSTIRAGEELAPVEATSEDAGPVCSPGDPDMFSAPTGAALRTYPKWAAFIASYGGRRRANIAESFRTGQLVDDDIDRAAGVWQFEGSFPRVVTSGFSQRRGRGTAGWHTGVDIPMDLDEPVYCVADGLVWAITSNTGSGLSVGVIHDNGYTTFYRHMGRLAEGVAVGELLKRNQIIAYCGRSSETNRTEMTHLHFETSVIVGSPVYDRYVPDRFVWLNNNLRNSARTDPAAVAQIGDERKVLASLRLLQGIGGGRRTESISAIAPDVAERFRLTFLPRRDGQFTINFKAFLMYSPVCQADPFSRAEDITVSGYTRDDVISQRDYFNQSGFKGIPAIKLPAQRPNTEPEPVPDIPSGVSDRRRRRIEQQRTAITTSNTRKASLRSAQLTNVQAQTDLFRDAVPPDECPPERYEDGTPRQPGEPLPGQARPSRRSAEGSVRRSTNE